MQVKSNILLIRCRATGLRLKVMYLLLIACLMVGAVTVTSAGAALADAGRGKGVVDVQTMSPNRSPVCRFRPLARVWL